MFLVGDPVPGSTISEISGNDPLIRIGGDFNEWLNITGTILVLGAASTSNGLYVCEVCLFRGTQFEECHMANTSLQVIGGPPFLDVATDNSKFCLATHASTVCILTGFRLSSNKDIVCKCSSSKYSIINNLCSNIHGYD